jgi:hypothetical protein
MTPELNWYGQPIRDGEGYGGRPENIPNTIPPKPAVKQHYCVVRESHLAEVFGNGAHKLTRAEAAKRLEELTGIPRGGNFLIKK